MRRITDDITAIPTAQVHHDPRQPRKSFDGIEALAASIVSEGLLQPITVALTGDDHFTIVTGERRYRATLLAGLPTIDCIVVEADSDFFVTQLRENMARQDFTFTEEVVGVRQALQRGLDTGTLADMLGRSESYVSDLAVMATLPVDMIHAVQEKTISKAVALLIANGPADKARTAFESAVKATSKGNKQMRANVKRSQSDKTKPTGKAGDPDAKEAAKVLDSFKRAYGKLGDTDIQKAINARTRKLDDYETFAADLRKLANNIETAVATRRAVLEG